MADDGKCDFCSSPRVVRLLPCRSFNSDSGEIGVAYAGDHLALYSLNEWAACDQCLKLIESLDLDGLVRHAVAAQEKLFGGRLPAELVAHVRYTYGLFFKNRMEETHG